MLSLVGCHDGICPVMYVEPRGLSRCNLNILHIVQTDRMKLLLRVQIRLIVEPRGLRFYFPEPLVEVCVYV